MITTEFDKLYLIMLYKIMSKNVKEQNAYLKQAANKILCSNN